MSDHEGSGSAGASHKNFDVMQAVSGRREEKQPRTGNQQFLDRYARENTSKLREEGMSHQKAFGLAMTAGRKVLATQQMLQRQLEGRDDVIKKAAQGKSGGDSKHLRR